MCCFISGWITQDFYKRNVWLKSYISCFSDSLYALHIIPDSLRYRFPITEEKNYWVFVPSLFASFFVLFFFYKTPVIAFPLHMAKYLRIDKNTDVKKEWSFKTILKKYLQVFRYLPLVNWAFPLAAIVNIFHSTWMIQNRNNRGSFVIREYWKPELQRLHVSLIH